MEINLFIDFKAWWSSFWFEIMNIVLDNTEKQQQFWLRNVKKIPNGRGRGWLRS